jgi:nitrate/nitrite transporter NarK
VEAVGISILLVGLVVTLNDLSLPQRAAADQIAAQVTIPGLAGILAQPVSGYIFDILGGRALFLIEALIILGAVGLLRRANRIHATGANPI